MQMTIITLGTRMPAWVNAGVAEYFKRLQHIWRIKLIELPIEKRGKNADINRLITKEGDKMLTVIPSAAMVIALDERGQHYTSITLAQQLQTWQLQTHNLCFLIGGPDGLDPRCLARADKNWSLAKLTFPHALVRIILVEQLYRAHTILNGMPYHRT